MHTAFRYILLIPFVLHAACHTPGEATSSSSMPAGNTAAKAKRGPSILSVILNAHASGSDVVFEIAQVSVKEGTYKHNIPYSNASWYKACLTDNAGNVLDSSLFENPLAERMEAVQDDGKLATTTNNKKENGVYIRAKYNSNITLLTIYDNHNKKLNTFNIQTYLK